MQQCLLRLSDWHRFFPISLLAIGYSSFEVLTYRWGVATVVLLVFAFLTKCDFHIGYKDFKNNFRTELAACAYFVQSCHSLSEYCKWCCFYHPFYVSAGCCSNNGCFL